MQTFPQKSHAPLACGWQIPRDSDDASGRGCEPAMSLMRRFLRRGPQISENAISMLKDTKIYKNHTEGIDFIRETV
jgi:hypothetical protein